MLFPKMTMPQPQGPRRVSVNTDGDSSGDRYNMLKSLLSPRNKDTATRQNFVRKLIEQQDRHFAYKRTVYDKMKTRLEWEKKEMELIIKIKKSEYENYFGDDFNTNEFMGKFTSRLTELEDRQEHIDVALSRLEARTDGKSREENTTQRIQAAFALIDERMSGASRRNIRNVIADACIAFSQNSKIFQDLFYINYYITGDPGTGKTEAAKCIVKAFSAFGILSRDDDLFEQGDRTTMVAPFVGQTASRVRNLLYKSLEGALFIDEAYQLIGSCDVKSGELSSSAGGEDYGPEAITTMVQFLSEYVGLVMIIAAGYKKAMQNCFIGTNEGLSRRFQPEIELKAFSWRELYAMFERKLADKDAEACEAMKKHKRSVMSFFQAHSKDMTNSAGDALMLAANVAIEHNVRSCLVSNAMEKKQAAFDYPQFLATMLGLRGSRSSRSSRGSRGSRGSRRTSPRRTRTRTRTRTRAQGGLPSPRVSSRPYITRRRK